MRQDNEKLLASVLTSKGEKSVLSVCETDRTYIHSFLHIIDFEYFCCNRFAFFLLCFITGCVLRPTGCLPTCPLSSRSVSSAPH